MEGMRPIQLDRSALAPGDVLGRHELLLPIARGGMGQVWAARLHGTRGFQKLVAVKTILPSNEDSGSLETMLFEEASIAAQVRHANVVETLDLGERDDGTLYLVMEWVSGEPLDHVLRAAEPVGGVPTAMLVHFAIQALCGLRAVHEARSARGEPLGIVHRDISPQNLLVTYDGIVKIIDFGIAKATQQMSRPTEEGMIKGKFAYMSPEQLRSEPLDGRADLFSLGVLLYRATTGEHPFQSDNLAATVRNILMAEPRRPTALVHGYSSSLEQVVLKALSKEPSERFGSAQDMLVALEQAVPEASNADIDKQCEAFLRQLFHDRIAERTRALQAAMTAADSTGNVATGEVGPRYLRSQSTMRAVSRETVEEATGGMPEPEREHTEAESPPRVDRPTRRVLGSVAMAAGVGMLLIVGLVGSRKSTTSQGGQARPQALEIQAGTEAPSVSVPSAPMASASASALPSPARQASPATAPKKRAPQVVEHSAIPAASGATQAAPEGAGTTVEVDPLSRRR